MPYFYNTPEDQSAMLAAIGAGSLDDLFAMVPAELRLKRPLAIPPAMSEMELTQHMTALAAKNEHAGSNVCFLGGGSYDHFIPAVVDELAGRGEFYTSYTPYQAEVSQGNLQVVFEYQTLIARLTGLDVSNASLYDGGSAAAEAVLMAVSSTQRYGKVVVAASVHPEYRQTIATYLERPWRGSRHGRHAAGCCAAARLGGRRRRQHRLHRRPATQLLRLHRRRRLTRDDRPRCRRAGRCRVRSDQPRPLKTPGRLGGRHRRRRRPHARHADAIRRPVPGHHGLPRETRPPHAGPHRRRNRRPPRQPLLRAHAANPRATHPPRKGHEQRLHQPRPVRPASHDLPIAPRPARVEGDRQPLPAKIPLRRRTALQTRSLRAGLRRANVQENSSSATNKAASKNCSKQPSPPASSPACRSGRGIRSWKIVS